MASLTARAEAVRADAARSRLRSLSLRMHLRRQLRLCEQRRAQLEATFEAVERRRMTPIPTSWSDLFWRLPLPQDEDVIELVE